MNPEAIRLQLIETLDQTLNRPFLSLREREVYTGLRGYFATAVATDVAKLSGFIPAFLKGSDNAGN